MDVPSAPGDRPVHVVTGASSGIGRAIAAALAGRGERVLAVARSADALRELCDAAGPGATAVVADVTTAHGRDAVATAAADAPWVASLVHGAGSVVEPAPFDELDADALVDHFRVHVAAPVALGALLRAQRRVGRIVHLDSYSATTPRDGWAAYSIVKAAAQMTARCAREELDDTIVVRVFPGAVRTPLVDAILASPSPAGDTFRELLGTGRVAEPAAVGAFVAAVLLDASDDELREDPVRTFTVQF